MIILLLIRIQFFLSHQIDTQGFQSDIAIELDTLYLVSSSSNLVPFSPHELRLSHSYVLAASRYLQLLKIDTTV
jgi:hypothetical protein